MSNIIKAIAAEGFTLSERNGAYAIDHAHFGTVYPALLVRDRYNFHSLKLRMSNILDNLKRGKDFHRVILQKGTDKPMSCVCFTEEGWGKVQTTVITAQLTAMGLLNPSLSIQQ